MHVVRNGAPIRTAVSAVPRRRLSAVATNAAKSVVVDENAKKPPLAAGKTSGFKPFKESVGLQSESNKSAVPLLGNLAKKRVMKKIKYYSDLLAESGNSIRRHKDVTDSLMGTLRAMGRPVPSEKLPPKEKWKGESIADEILQTLVPMTSPDKITFKDSKSRGITRKTSIPQSEHNGWEGEDWGPDALRPEKSYPEENIRSSDIKQTPPHISPPLSYTRRLEGLSAPLGTPVLENVEQISAHHPIATLKHDLDRVLFNPGVHWLQDPRTGVYNFTPWLEHIPDVENFAFERLPAFIKSSRDEDLWALAKRENRIFGGSTSSLTGILSHIYFLISGDRNVDVSSLSRYFQHQPSGFTLGQRMAASVLLNYNDGVYAIDSVYNDDPEKNVLTWLGTMLEKFLTMSSEDFKRLLRDSQNPMHPDTDPRREAYRYAMSNKFVMRSQLDCHDNRLPGTGVFDIKTRGVLPIRMDAFNYQEYSGYRIRTLQGPVESFEKEYYDLVRSAFLKYSFQARIGNMDGVLVAHHNASRIFGFQYIPLSEMDTRLFGDSTRGERVFEKCVLLLEEVMVEVIGCFPNQSVRCMVETPDRKGVMSVWVEPEDHDEETNGPRPIVQLDVESTSYLGEQEVRGSTAVSSDDAWILHWKIFKSSLSDEEKRAKRKGAEERRFRAWNLPTGVDLETMELQWNQIDYGGERRNDGAVKSTVQRSTFDPTSFRPASSNIEMLRQLSKGMENNNVKVLDTASKPKVILGDPCRTDLDTSELSTTMTDAAPGDQGVSLTSPSVPLEAESDLATETNVACNSSSQSSSELETSTHPSSESDTMSFSMTAATSSADLPDQPCFSSIDGVSSSASESRSDEPYATIAGDDSTSATFELSRLPQDRMAEAVADDSRSTESKHLKYSAHPTEDRSIGAAHARSGLHHTTIEVHDSETRTEDLNAEPLFSGSSVPAAAINAPGPFGQQSADDVDPAVPNLTVDASESSSPAVSHSPSPMQDETKS